MPDRCVSSYDEVPYADTVFAYTHPDHLAVMVRLFGLNTPPPERCRVLELGCGTGTNLVAIALSIPCSECVGIDLSRRQIEMANDKVSVTGARNTVFHAMNLLDVDRSFGKFDYIIVHGVYSWVSKPVRERILDICKENLSPHGVAYVSYNTYPGWHFKAAIRSIMSYHARKFESTVEQIEQGRAILDFLNEAVGGGETLYGGLLQAESQQIANKSDDYVFHEFLEEENNPVYFREFALRAAGKGLQYVCEADPVPLTRNLPPEIATKLQSIASDVLDAEQYLDFVRNRAFRRTLLCHSSETIQRPPDAARIKFMSVTTHALAVKQPVENLAPGVLQFIVPHGARISTNNPLIKGGLQMLENAHPIPIAVPELWEALTSEDTVPMTEQEREAIKRAGPGELYDTLLQCFMARLIELHITPPVLVKIPGAYPTASPLARYLASRKKPVANLRHEQVILTEFEGRVLVNLNGKNDRATLARQLDTSDEEVEESLTSIARKGLLIS
jgi:SAM-dependent methyltransferase/methyltransferase-like protein